MSGYHLHMRPLRILYHHRTQGRGAEGNHIVSIVTAMRAAGHHVDVLSPPGVDPFNALATVPVDASPVKARGWAALWRAVSLHMPGAIFELAECLYNLPAYFRLRRALRDGRYDLVFERYASYLAAGAFAAKRAGLLFALEINDVSGVADRVRKQHFPRLCAAVEKRVLARCDLAHAVSSYLADRLVELGVPPAKVVVVPNGFDPSRISLSRGRDAVRAEYGLTDTLVIGFAGWFVPWDRIDFLIEVFATVHARLPKLRLCLVGDGTPAREAVERLRGTSLADAVVLTGAVPRQKVYDLIQMFDIGLLPHSNLFGSPVVMFEMMGLGVPLLLPALPPIRDVHADGDTALLFAPLDHEDCSRKLLRLAESVTLRRELAQRAYVRLVETHTWLHTAERILAALPQPAATNGAAATTAMARGGET